MRMQFDLVQDVQGVMHPITSQVVAVDNARESVAADGLILGIPAIRVLPSKKETLLMLAAYAHPFLLVAAEGVRLARRRGENPAITYDTGTEIHLRLTSPPSWSSLACAGPLVPDLPADPLLDTMVLRWPVRTESGQPARSADWVNVAFVGARTDLERAFAAGGWTTAVENSLRADVRVFLSLAEREGYRSGPVSLLTLGGTDPALVFQKQNNTFAMRHHVRIWSSSFAYRNQPVWIGAATHDTGIEFSASTKHFTHRIDGQIDLERAKVLGDLGFTGSLRGYAMVVRPPIPPRSENAAGDAVMTDGRIVIMFLGGNGG